jgi:putative transposase
MRSSDRHRPSRRKPRLHRLDRVFADHPIYFLTLCVQARRRALESGRVHAAISRFGTQGIARGCRLGRYVLMPDHLHAFVAFDSADRPAATALPAWVKALKGCVSKSWREAGHGDVRWQKGFFDHVLRTSASYAEKWQYVAMNPVRAGLVSRSDDWPFQGEICRLEAPL